MIQYPADTGAEKDPAYRAAAHMYTKQYDTLKNSLGGNLQIELIQLNDLHDLLLSMQDEAAFKLGFRLGVQMMCACLDTSPPKDRP